jgi:hypothetical protein
MVESHDGAMALAHAGVRVRFPNLANHPPGTRLRFRSYDPHGFGWYTIGHLTVSPDGRQIAAAPGVTLGEVECVDSQHERPPAPPAPLGAPGPVT